MYHLIVKDARSTFVTYDRPFQQGDRVHFADKRIGPFKTIEQVKKYLASISDRPGSSFKIEQTIDPNDDI